jgi:hypothetical protein
MGLNELQKLCALMSENQMNGSYLFVSGWVN